MAIRGKLALKRRKVKSKKANEKLEGLLRMKPRPYQGNTYSLRGGFHTRNFLPYIGSIAAFEVNACISNWCVNFDGRVCAKPRLSFCVSPPFSPAIAQRPFVCARGGMYQLETFRGQSRGGAAFRRPGGFRSFTSHGRHPSPKVCTYADQDRERRVTPP